MKKLLVVLALAVCVGAATAVMGSPAVTAVSGRVGGEITLTGSGWGNGPVWAYYETFDNWSTGYVDSTASGNKVVLYKWYGTADSTETVTWQAQRMDVAGKYPWSRKDERSKFGSFSLGADMKDGTGSGANQSDFKTNCYFYLANANGSDKIDGNAKTSIFASAWYYDECDTAKYGTLTARGRSLISLIGTTGNDSDVVAGYLSSATNPDSSAGVRFGTRKGLTFRPWGLKGANFRRITLNSNEWNRVDVWAKAETGGGSDGRLFTYYNYALVDSARNINYGSGTAGWDKIRFNTAWANADSFSTARTYWDGVYLASGPNRVELGDKIYYQNCTQRYIQPIKSWSSTSIVFYPVLGTMTASQKLYVFVTGDANVGGLSASSTAIDSIYVVVPSIAATSDTTTYEDESLTLTWDNDSDDNARTGYNAIQGEYTVDWGDGSARQTTATASLAHTYTNPGVFTVKVFGTNEAGVGTGVAKVLVAAPQATVWLGKATYDDGYVPGFSFGTFSLYAPSAEVEFKLGATINGRSVRLFPSEGSTDSLFTVPRGTVKSVTADDLPLGRATWAYYKTLNTAGDDSTAIHIEVAK